MRPALAIPKHNGQVGRHNRGTGRCQGSTSQRARRAPRAGGEQGKGRPSWRALLRQRRLSPRASAALSSKSIGPSNEKKSDDTEVIPPVLSRTRRGSAYRKPGGRCSVGAHFSRAPARLCRTDGGGAAPRESRTTRRSSLQFYHERGAAAPPAFDRVSTELLAGGAGFWALPAFQRSGTAAGSGSGSPSGKPSGAAGQTEADVVVAVGRVVVVVAVGNSAVVRIVVPAAAADATVGGSVQSMADARKWLCRAFLRKRSELAVLAYAAIAVARCWACASVRRCSATKRSNRAMRF